MFFFFISPFLFFSFFFLISSKKHVKSVKFYVHFLFVLIVSFACLHQVMGSLVTSIRQFQAIISLQNSILAKDILRFRRMDVFCCDNVAREHPKLVSWALSDILLLF